MSYSKDKLGQEPAFVYGHISKRLWIATMAMQSWIQVLGLRHKEDGYSDESAAVEAAKLGELSAEILLEQEKEEVGDE